MMPPNEMQCPAGSLQRVGSLEMGLPDGIWDLLGQGGTG